MIRAAPPQVVSAVLLALLGACQPKRHADPAPQTSAAAPEHSHWSVSGYAVLRGAAQWSDGKPAAGRPLWISCPPGFAVYPTTTDSAGRFEQRLGLPDGIVIPENGLIPCRMRLEARPRDPNAAEQLVSVFFARTPEQIGPTEAPVMVARESSRLAEFPTQRLRAAFRIRPLGAETLSDTLPRAWSEDSTLHVRGALPLSEETRDVIIVPERTGPDIRILVQVKPKASGSRTDVAPGPAGYEGRIWGVPAGEYTLRIKRMIVRGGPESRNTFLPDQVVPRVRVPGAGSPSRGR